MCDEGRMTYKDVHQERLAGPLVDGLPSSWDKALGTAVDKLQAVLDEDRGAAGVVLSAGHSNEDNYLLARLAREFLGIERVYVNAAAPRPERADKILRDADVNANSAGVKAIAGTGAKDRAALEKDLASGALKALVVLGSEPLSEEAAAKAATLPALVVVAAHERRPGRAGSGGPHLRRLGRGLGDHHQPPGARAAAPPGLPADRAGAAGVGSARPARAQAGRDLRVRPSPRGLQ
jgi:anaerobic selenocysteine-containing dehydrogenase